MLKSFCPILGVEPKVLILGSMPSQKSLEIQQYYAHPQNSFWWVMANILGFSFDLPYSKKVDELKKARVAVWDVLHECQREGSLDRSIIRDTEVVNDISELLTSNLSIELLGFNGGAAKTIFNRHIDLASLPRAEPMTVQLPSTSPAHASITKKQKYQVWQDAMLPYINDESI